MVKNNGGKKSISKKSLPVEEVASDPILKKLQKRATVRVPKKPAIKKVLPIKKDVQPKKVEVLLPISESGPFVPVEMEEFKDEKELKITAPNSDVGRGVMVKLIIAIVIAALFVLAADIFGMYKLEWRDGFSHGVARVLRLPAGTVDGRTIKLADYLDNVKILEVAVAQDREGIDTAILNDKQGLNDRIFNLITANLLVDEELDRYNKKITDQELDAQMENLIIQMNGQDTAKATIRDLYNLSIDQFKNKILKPLMAQETLQQLIIQDDSLVINQEAKKKADDVLKLAIRPEVDFKTLANQSTEDEAGINIGGDLGWIIRGEADPELEAILFSLQPNSVYGQVIKNKTGYHIIKVEEKMNDRETGKESVKARQILIKVDVNQYIKSLMDKVAIKKFVKI